jgi:TetR/AcrR family transcriptional regulator
MPPAGSAAPMSPHVREKRRKRRGEILHAALRAFGEQGYHGTTLEHIADQLGVQKSALYHYFPDKEAILYACHRESLAEVRRLLREARERFTGASERLRHVIREHVRVMTDTLEGSSLAFEVPSLSPEHERKVVAARDRYEQALRAIIADGVQSGEFRSIDPKVAVFVILGAINWIARWYRPDGAFAARELGNEFADYLVGGLMQEGRISGATT